MTTYRILLLEDDLETVSKIINSINSIEKEFEADIAVTVLAEYTQVEDYLNNATKNIFDLILLDRDCKAGGSFHILNFDKYPIDKIIGISSNPSYNEELRKQGVKKIIHKDFQNLDKFIEEVQDNIREKVSLC